MRPGTILQGDLARHLQDCGFLTFTEIEIRGTEADGWGTGRVDVVAIKPHRYARKDLRAYECKASREDFMRDIDTEKWRRYQDVFPRVYFAVPSGLVAKAEVPGDAGLIVRGENGWSVVKAARQHAPPKLSVDSVLALLFRGYEEHRKIRNLRDRLVYSDRGIVQDAQAFGWDVRHRLAQKAHELDRPLQELKEALEALTGKPMDGFSVEQLTRRLQTALAIVEEAEKHGEALRHISLYLDSLRSSYSSAERRDGARQSLMESVG